MNFNATKIWRGFGLLVVITVFIFSCKKDTANCYEPSDVKATIRFRTRTVVDSTIDSTGADTTFVRYRDTIFPALIAQNLDYDSFGVVSSTNTSLWLYLDPNKDSTRYFLKYNDVDPAGDTLKLYYTAQPFFISNDCGYTYYYHIDSLRLVHKPSADTSVLMIDSFAINNRDVTKDLSKTTATFYYFY